MNIRIDDIDGVFKVRGLHPRTNDWLEFEADEELVEVLKRTLDEFMEAVESNE